MVSSTRGAGMRIVPLVGASSGMVSAIGRLPGPRGALGASVAGRIGVVTAGRMMGAGSVTTAGRTTGAGAGVLRNSSAEREVCSR